MRLLKIGCLMMLMTMPLFGARFSSLMQNLLIVSANAEVVTANTARAMFYSIGETETSTRKKGNGLVFKQEYLTNLRPTVNLLYFPNSRLDMLVGTNNVFTLGSKNHIHGSIAFGFSESSDLFTSVFPSETESQDHNLADDHFQIVAKFVSGNVSSVVRRHKQLDIRPSQFSSAITGRSPKTAAIVIRGDHTNGINVQNWDTVGQFEATPTATLEVWGNVHATKLMFANDFSPLFVSLQQGEDIIANDHNEGIVFNFENSDATKIGIYTVRRTEANQYGRPILASRTRHIWQIDGFGTDNNSTIASVSTPKTFTIPHPIDENKYLSHAMIESPENRVYYRGEVQLIDGKATVTLPHYVKALTHDQGVNIQLQSVDSFDRVAVKTQRGKKIRRNKFKIISENSASTQTVHWEVSLVRKDLAPLIAEPLKDQVKVKGHAPYLYYEVK